MYKDNQSDSYSSSYVLMEENGIICFVCMDKAQPLYKVCDCNTFIHEKCMNDLLNKVDSHTDKCPVCTKFYDFEKKKGEYEIQCHKIAFAIFFLISIATITLCVTGAYILFEHESMSSYYIGVAFIMSACFCICFLIKFSQNMQVCAVKRIEKKKIKLLTMQVL